MNTDVVLAPLFAKAATDPETLLLLLGGGHIISRSVHAFAELGVGDALASGPKTAHELATLLGVDATSLFRVAALLSGLGLIEIDQADRLSLGKMGAVLRSEGRFSATAFFRLLSQEQFNVYVHFIDAMREGATAWSKAFPVTTFEWLAQHPDKLRLFNEAMRETARSQAQAICTIYDFSHVQTIIDVGGGTGNVARTIISRFPHLKICVTDLEPVIEEGRSLGDEYGAISFLARDLFSGSVPSADLYMLKHVLHDWDDELCIKILKNIRTASRDCDRLLICERILPSKRQADAGYMLDIHMMVMTGGRERRLDEFVEILHAAGFGFQQVITNNWVSIIESFPIPI